MVHIKRRAGHLDYRLCNQTVTVYHFDGKETVERKVFQNAFLDFKKIQGISRTGSTEVNSFLLVIPCSEVPVAAGDKVLLGEGPEISTVKEWREFIPPTVPGLVVVKYADPKYWKGRLVHIEAGGG